jgi:hypothetical protein
VLPQASADLVAFSDASALLAVQAGGQSYAHAGAAANVSTEDHELILLGLQCRIH